MGDPNNSCAERPANLILHTGLVFDLRKPLTLVAECDAVGGAAK